MALDSNTIAAGKTYRRAQVKEHYPKLTRSTNFNQLLINVFDRESNTWVNESFEPVTEGHLLVYTPSYSDSVIATMYVAINIGGTLTWVRATTTPYPLDPNTGVDWDPSAVFYSPLAS